MSNSKRKRKKRTREISKNLEDKMNVLKKLGKEIKNGRNTDTLCK
ncbi:MAG: hypothetical protein PHC87_06210 [Actinomycetota bacterium]|nr:hypothetical protein [Actinomycetota bacterium]